MTLVQNAALRKNLGGVRGSSGKKMNAIAAVENVETFVKAASRGFLAWTLCNPLRAGVGQVEEDLAQEGELSFGGSCCREGVHIIDVGPYKTSDPTLWEEAVKCAAERRLVVYTDGSRDDGGRVGGGWYADDNGASSVAVGNVATVWDGEVAGIRQALRLALDMDILALTD